MPASGPALARGTVIPRNGLIVTIPADAWVFECEGLAVYPGLIDALSTVEQFSALIKRDQKHRLEFVENQDWLKGPLPELTPRFGDVAVEYHARERAPPTRWYRLASGYTVAVD